MSRLRWTAVLLLRQPVSTLTDPSRPVLKMVGSNMYIEKTTQGKFINHMIALITDIFMSKCHTGTRKPPRRETFRCPAIETE